MAEKVQINADKLKVLDAVMQKIEKDFGKGSIMRMNSTEVNDIPVIPTGSITLDMALGVGGYPKGRVVPPEEQLAVLRGYLAEHSIASRQDFVKLLHVTPHQATNILKHMVERGELIRVGKRYQLPQETQPAEK